MRIARKIADALSKRLAEKTSTEWDVEVTTERLPMDSEGDIPVFRHAPRLRDAYNWDYLVYLTDLPLISHHDMLLCKTSSEAQTAMISLPSLGAIGAAKRAEVIIASLVVASHTNFEDASPEQSVRQVLGRGVTYRQPDPDNATSIRIYLSGFRHRLGLLTGVIKSNRPTRLVAALTNSIALGAATGAFGVFYGSVWELADALSPLRLVLISLIVCVLMGGWLILKNGLWMRGQDSEGRWQARMENTATVVTIGTGVALLYLVLFAVLFVLSFSVVDQGYLSTQLGHAAGFSDYVGLSWLSGSLGTLAGALGSNFNDPDTIREATYSRRVYQRRKLADQFEDNEDDDDQ